MWITLPAYAKVIAEEGDGAFTTREVLPLRQGCNYLAADFFRIAMLNFRLAWSIIFELARLRSFSSRSALVRRLSSSMCSLRSYKLGL